LKVERTSSRTGKHLARSVVVVVGSGGRVKRVISEPTSPSRGTYSRGSSGTAVVELEPGDLAVWVRLVRNLRGIVSGRMVVYDSSGSPLLEAVYRKLKVRRSRGDPSYSWVVEAAVKALKLDRYVRGYNWGTGSE